MESQPDPSPANSSNTPPLTPKPISRSDPNPYPTTFVQADTTSFKQVVQMLTGSSKVSSIPPVKTGQQKKQGFKLYERRNSLKNGLMINPSVAKSGQESSPRVRELLSPSILDFPSLVLSPVTPLVESPFNNNNNKSSSSVCNSEEERVIAEKGFYLHPSPRAATAEPRLLPLFPVTSPRVSESSV